jgi:hypothetical protein
MARKNSLRLSDKVILIIAMVVAVLIPVSLATLRYVWMPGEIWEPDSLIDLKTETTPDQSRVRVQGRLISGIQFIQSVSTTTEASAMLLTVKGNLPLLAGLHFGPRFDATFAVPANVHQIQVGNRRGVLWRRGDCLKRFQDHNSIWHCEGNT